MAAGNPRVPQTSQQGLEEIKELLESKLSDLQTQLHHLRATEANNPIGWLPGKNLEQTKKVLIQTMINRVTPQSADFRSSGELLFKTVLEKLEMQFKETTRLIDSEKRVLNQLNEKINSLQEKIASFDNMVSARLVSGEMKQAENLDKIQKQLEVELRKHKHMLKHVVNIIYPGNRDIKQLLAELVQSYLDNPKDYIELTSERDVETLTTFLPVGLVVWHPYDKMKVKLGEEQ